MAYTKLKRHDIINVTKGMKITADIPEKFVNSKVPFSDEKVPSEIIVGKIYEFPLISTITVKGIKKQLSNSIKNVFSHNNLSTDKYGKNIKDFIEGLDLKIVEDSFDTSIYEGDYKVYFTTTKNYNHIVYCEKLDDSGIEIMFVQNYSENNRVKILNEQN